ncbi:LAME_0F03620g1_1 [Lachancea meyersii CBS 8951]|uniref:triacylglycerol lipase n=1 Tax=Lachancea meyersii CBS 8951 TaxID=1266667 RepID=A0A1G4JRG0_9SACH|nr:LAME_0F03620g1_1 [Lachancea meyersii CBS 8951]
MRVVPGVISSVLLAYTGLCAQLERNGSTSSSRITSFRDIEILNDTLATSQTETGIDAITVWPAKSKPYDDVQISQELYERLVYFSKICALTYCITGEELVVGSTFAEGGCPAKLDFCSDETINPTAGRTVVELVLLAESNELGTGFLAVDHEKEVVVLSFRGSSTNQDWLSDFAIYPTPYEPVSKEHYRQWVDAGRISECEDCLVHRGFNVFLKTLSSQFFERIEAIFDTFPDYNLVVTGHSLGAAVASLAGIELRLRGHDPLVLTYASPNIFSGKLRAWVDELFETERIHQLSLDEGEVMFRKGYFRVVHDGDYITMVPPFYEPAGLELFITHRELPQRLEDLQYRGSSTNIVSLENGNVSLAGSGQGHRFLGPLERWIHMYEHRAYFLLINTCDGF